MNSRALRLIWFVTWFNVRMLLTSEFFILTTFLTPLIFATLPSSCSRRAGPPRGRRCSMALGSGMMGVWSTTLFGGGAIAWQRWEDAGAARQRAVALRLHLAAQTFGVGAASTASWRPSGACCCSACRSRHLPADPAHLARRGRTVAGALGMLIATTFVLYRHANALGNLLEYPIWLIAGLLVPIATLPWVRPINWLLAHLGHGGDSRRGPRHAGAVVRDRHVPGAGGGLLRGRASASCT